MSDQQHILHLVVRGDNLEETALHYTLHDHQAIVRELPITTSKKLLYIVLIYTDMEQLDSTVLVNQLPSLLYEHWIEEMLITAVTRITLEDGQRLVYVQGLDCYKSFLFQDAHASFQGIGGKRSNDDA